MKCIFLIYLLTIILYGLITVSYAALSFDKIKSKAEELEQKQRNINHCFENIGSFIKIHNEAIILYKKIKKLTTARWIAIISTNTESDDLKERIKAILNKNVASFYIICKNKCKDIRQTYMLKEGRSANQDGLNLAQIVQVEFQNAKRLSQSYEMMEEMLNHAKETWFGLEMIPSLLSQPFVPSSSVFSSSLLLSARSISTTMPLARNTAGKYNKTSDRSFRLTYQMTRKPTHIGVSKNFMTFHSQNLEGFRQQQPTTIAQDEVVIRFMRGIFYKHLTANGTEFVIKRRGNVLYVTGFLQYGKRLNIKRLYWLIGFTEELLSNLLKQPVKFEIQFVEDENILTYTYI